MMQEREKRGPGRPREFDMGEALDKAVEVFWELGYEAADTETLSSRMGLSKPSLYNAFGPKEDLFLRALRRYGETVSKASEDTLLNAGGPKEGLHAYSLAIAQDVAGQRHPSGCLIACVAMPASERMPKVAATLRESSESARARVTAYFETEAEKGTLPPTFNAPAAVSLMQDLALAMGLQGRMGCSLMELEECAARHVELVMFEGDRG